MKDELKGMMFEEMDNVQQLHIEMKGALHRADSRLEETAQKIDDIIQNIFTEVSFENIQHKTFRMLFLTTHSSSVLQKEWH